MPDATPKTDPLEGTRYRTVGLLGRGGMGVVVDAERIGLGKRFAIKLLHADMSKHAGLVDRMRIEAQTLARLESPYLVEVHDLDVTPTGRPFVVMDRLHGRSLRDELKSRGALPVDEALAYASQALRGLHAAHEVGVVHRDVKLDNLFLCDPVEDGPRVVKVLDFGVAKVLGGEGAPDKPILPTEEGATVGTPRFLSPEQARGKPVDARSDVYAVGLALYSMVAGRDPFHDVQGFLDLVRAHAVRVPEPPSRLAPQPIPAELDDAILRALRKDPAERFASAAEFARALDEIARGLHARALATTEPVSRRAAPGSIRTGSPSPISDALPSDAVTVPLTRYVPPPSEAASEGDDGSATAGPAPTRPLFAKASWSPFVVALLASMAVFGGIVALLLRHMGLWR